MDTSTLLSSARAALLSNGHYAVLINDVGTGHSAWDNLAITRWRGDWLDEGDGMVLFVRDLDTRAVWSLTPCPRVVLGDRVELGTYSAELGSHQVRFTSSCGGIEASVVVQVAGHRDCEARTITLTNKTGLTRRLELISYVELALNYHGADAAHPGFSKLFVQTEFVSNTLLAHRRPRSPGDALPWVFHRLATFPVTHFETDRVKFIGRGRDLSGPLLLAANRPLTNSAGNVLDPIFSLGHSMTLEPGVTQRCQMVLGVAPNRQQALAIAAEFDALECPLQQAMTSGSPELPRHIQVYLRGRAAQAGASSSVSSALDLSKLPAGALVHTQVPLQHDNGYGGFSVHGNEYVIRITPDEHGGLRLPPMPWTNTVANERVGFLISETGAGYTWSRNSREHRLTPWHNDPVRDPHGEALWWRDRDNDTYWSPVPGPTAAKAAYTVIHGFGYTEFRLECAELEQTTRFFVARHDPVKITHLRLRNRGTYSRRISLYSLQSLVLGVLAEETREHIETAYCRESELLTAVNTSAEDFAGATAFSFLIGPASSTSYSTEQSSLVDYHEGLRHAVGVRYGSRLNGFSGRANMPCFAWQTDYELAPEGTLDVFLLFGETNADAIDSLAARYRQPGYCEQAFADVQAFWRETVSGLQVATPSSAIDLMLNGWLLYQVLSCRLWGRSAYYQSGGAFGFRDQLQDSMAFLHTNPGRAREQLLLHAAHQFREGDVLHWWHPPWSRGIRTRFSDDLLWMPLFTALYVRTTGDADILKQRVRFLQAEALMPGEDETFLLPEDAGESGDLYEHCVRALDRSLTKGVHGLPLMGTGDWNDGMNRVGREGRGESVWVGFFLYEILGGFLPFCRERGDTARYATYSAYRDSLRVALNADGWDGGWYRRAYYDDGTPLGSAANDECQIDALAQSWSVISGVAPPDRAEQAMDAVERYLVSEADGLIRLLTPPFDKTPHDAGYIKGYVPGIRENGGQYTHGALWVVQALAMMGRRERAAQLLEMLSPVSHALTPAQVAVYQVEPYVIAADIYGAQPHVGRGGWTWYTGSAAWMYRIAVEWILGIRVIAGNALTIVPCIPDSWPGYTVTYRLPGGHTSYRINVSRCTGTEITLLVDGCPLALSDNVPVIPLKRDDVEHLVELHLPATPAK